MTIDDLLPDPRNPRAITSQAALGLQASLRAFGDLGMAWNRTTGEMVSGHQRVAALRAEANRRGVDLRVEEHGDHCFVVLPPGGGMEGRQFYCRIVEMSRAEQNAANLAANNPGIQGEFTADVGALLAEAQESFPDLYDEIRLGEILEEAQDVTDVKPSDTPMYTEKITAPIYEPKGEKPTVAALYDSERSDALIQVIQDADLPQNEKDFLIAAARRHVVFNYHNIADYYAHSSPPVQRLMEDSALVIIDYNRAIELGYVKVSEAVDEQRLQDYPDGGDCADD